MKKLLIVLFTLIMCISLVACNKKEEKVEEVISTTTGLPNPMVEYESLEAINSKIGVNLIRPSTMGVSNEKFSVINDTIAEYTCEINGLEWIFRGAYITEDDISGMYNEHNVFTPNEDFGLYVNEFYLDRFFDGNRQYTIVVKNPITEDGKELIDEETFMNCCMELESIQKQHMDDPLVGDYQDIVSQRATAYVERFGDTYNISVNWPSSTNEMTCWTMYNATKDGDKLSYAGEDIYYAAYDSNGNEVSSKSTATNNLGYFEIKDNMLYWTGAGQEECRTCVFEKVIYE